LLTLSNVHLLSKGERYLQQSQDLQQSAKKVAMGRKKENDDDTQSSTSSDTSDSSDEVAFGLRLIINVNSGRTID